jgi:hypothetical protein
VPPNQDDLALVGDQPDAVGHDLLKGAGNHQPGRVGDIKPTTAQRVH